jgi:hypothetical protein
MLYSSECIVLYLLLSVVGRVLKPACRVPSVSKHLRMPSAILKGERMAALEVLHLSLIANSPQGRFIRAT